MKILVKDIIDFDGHKLPMEVIFLDDNFINLDEDDEDKLLDQIVQWFEDEKGISIEQFDWRVLE